MIFNVSSEEYDASGLGDCCLKLIKHEAYCGGPLSTGETHSDGTAVCVLRPDDVSSRYSGRVVNGASPEVACAINSHYLNKIPKSQADCNHIGNKGIPEQYFDAIFVPEVKENGYTPLGKCILKVGSGVNLNIDANSDCDNQYNASITQLIDLCDLAGSVFNLSPMLLSTDVRYLQ